MKTTSHSFLAAFLAITFGLTPVAFADLLASKIFNKIQTECRDLTKNIQSLDSRGEKLPKFQFIISQIMAGTETLNEQNKAQFQAEMVELNVALVEWPKNLGKLREEYKLLEPVCDQVLKLTSADRQDPAIVSYYEIFGRIYPLRSSEEFGYMTLKIGGKEMAQGLNWARKSEIMQFGAKAIRQIAEDAKQQQLK